MTTKAALKLLGQDVGGVRLPLVECDENETAALDEMLRRRGLLSAV
jgi:4-hydroxy-tetrahydrodipicolinate synthase